MPIYSHAHIITRLRSQELAVCINKVSPHHIRKRHNNKGTTMKGLSSGCMTHQREVPVRAVSQQLFRVVRVPVARPELGGVWSRCTPDECVEAEQDFASGVVTEISHLMSETEIRMSKFVAEAWRA